MRARHVAGCIARGRSSCSRLGGLIRRSALTQERLEIVGGALQTGYYIRRGAAGLRTETHGNSAYQAALDLYRARHHRAKRNRTFRAVHARMGHCTLPIV